MWCGRAFFHCYPAVCLAALLFITFFALLVIGSCTQMSVYTDIELRLYQLKGVDWLVRRYGAGHGSILADEMGLGKTCQVQTVIQKCYRVREGNNSILTPVV